MRIEVEQNTDEWFKLRSGKFTGSAISSLFMKETTKGYKDAIKRIALERILGDVPDDHGISSQYMERGHEFEGDAVDKYCDQTYADTIDGAFYEIGDWVGASPDRVIINKGDKHQGLEIKCPAFNTMITYSLENDELYKAYKTQVQSQIYVCEFDWVDLVAYHPDFKLVIIRVERDEEYIDSIKVKIEKATKEVTETIELLKGYKA